MTTMRTAGHWDTTALDLAAYLDRIGLPREEPSAAALDRLMTAHTRAVPFENVDVVLGTHPGVELPAVVDKLVTRRRGGYCYEHVALVGAVLEQLGYPVCRYLARIDPERSGWRTHATLVAAVDGTEYLVDAGFGGGMLHPMPLREDTIVDQAGWPHRLVHADGVWTVQKLVDGAWQSQHSHEPVLAWPSDFAIGHHYVNTHPHSPFTGTLLVFRAMDGWVRRIRGFQVRDEYPDGRVTERTAGAAEIEALLPELGIELSTAEWTALHDWLARQ